MQVLKITTAPANCHTEQIEMAEFTAQACLLDAYGNEADAERNWDNIVHQVFPSFVTFSTIVNDERITYIDKF
jgi:hypothetical protein